VTNVQSRCIGLDFGNLSIKNAVRDPLSLTSLKRLSLAELHDRAADIYSIDIENVQVAISDSVPSLTVIGDEGWNDAHQLIPKISLRSFAKMAFRPPPTMPRFEFSAIAENLLAGISDTQIIAFRTIVQQLIPQFGDEAGPTAKATPEEIEEKIDRRYTEAEINRIRNKEAFIFAVQLDVSQAGAEVTTNTNNQLSKGKDRFLSLDAEGLKARMKLYSFRVWAEAELHGATIETADEEPLLVSDEAQPIVKVSYEQPLGAIPIGVDNKINSRRLNCEIGKVQMNVPERIWEFIDDVQRLAQIEAPTRPLPDVSSQVTLPPPELIPQDETVIFLDVEDVQVALFEDKDGGNRKVATVNLGAFQMMLKTTSADTTDKDDEILRKMTARVNRLTARHHLHEFVGDDDDMGIILDFGREKEGQARDLLEVPATLDFVQFDRTSPNYPGWMTSIRADVTQDILFNVDQDPLSYMLRYILKVQARKPPSPSSPSTPNSPPPEDNGLSEFKFDVALSHIIANLYKPGTFRSHSRDHISFEIGNIAANDLIHPKKQVPTLGRLKINPVTIHSMTYDADGRPEMIMMLEQASVTTEALLERVIETATMFEISKLNIQPRQLRMVLDGLGVIAQIVPLAMQAKDALAGSPPPVEVEHDPAAEVTVTGKHRLQLTGLDVDLVSGKHAVPMLGLNLPDLEFIATMTSDGDITVLLDLRSFSLRNPRSQHFPDLIPAITEEDVYQLSVRAVLPQDKSTPMDVLVSLVNPEIILDVDAIVSVLSEVLSFKSELAEVPTKHDEPSGPLPTIELTMQAPRLTLLEDPSDPNTSAITASAEFIALDTTDDSLFKVLEACMYQSRMGSDGEPVLFVDHFGVDAHKEGAQWKANVDPIILRISPRDIKFALSLQKNVLPKIQKISELMASPSPRVHLENPETDIPEMMAQVLTKTNYEALLGGMRLVFIGDMPEIPILDMKVKEFNIDMTMWDNFKEINVITSTIATSFNMYNFAKSKWEPVIEPWEVTAHLAFHQPPQPGIEFTVMSGKRLDFVISTRTVDMVAMLQGMMARVLSDTPIPMRLSSIASTLTMSPQQRLAASTAPYRIVNRTGLVIHVSSDEQHPGGSRPTDIPNEGSIPWRFDSWRNLRENMNVTTDTNLLDIELKGTSFQQISRVPVSFEGSRPYRLKPADTKVAHHVLCEVKLGGDNIKEVVIRSTYLIENTSMNDLEIRMLHGNGEHTDVTIAAGTDYAVPVLLAQSCQIRVRPPQGYGYDWSNQPFIWSDFLRNKSKRTIRCKSGSAASFNLLAYAVINKSTPLASQYPFMTLRISTPLKLVNLLPHEIRYQLYDKRLQEKFLNTVQVGEESPVHSVELSHLLLVAIDALGAGYEASEYAVVNPDDPREFRREDQLNLKDKKGGRLHLGLRYSYVTYFHF
jgi:hypothetical protein